MPVHEVRSGKVKYFNKEGGFGFIKQDERGEPDLFFHIKTYSGPVERTIGELELGYAGENPYSLSGKIPKYGDKVVFVVTSISSMGRDKGPSALIWAFAEDWNKALEVIKARPDPENYQVRLIRYGTEENQHKPTIIWEGTDQEFREKLNENWAEVYEQECYFESLLATGWERRHHPTSWHPRYKKSSSM